jgi:hypothetical protein
MQARERVLLSEEEQVNNERLKVTVLRAKQDQVSRMTDDQIMRSIRALDIEDPTVLQVLPAYQEAASEEAKLLNSGLGANHPEVKSLRARKDVMEKQLKEQIGVLRKTLADNLRIAEDQLAELESGLKNSRDLQQESKTRSSAYFVAKNDYIQAKKLLEAAETRLTTETMQRMMPQSPVTIWERAEPSQFPARPRVVLNIALSVVVGLAFGLGLAFFVEHLDTSVKTIEDIEAFLSVPVLAVIPKKISLLMDVCPNHPDAEAYRILRTNIEFSRRSPALSSVLDSVVIVVQHRRFPRAMLQRIKQAVVGAGGNILGVVLNNVDIRHDRYYGYAANYRNYYPKPRRSDRKLASQRAIAAQRDTESY